MNHYKRNGSTSRSTGGKNQEWHSSERHSQRDYGAGGESELNVLENEEHSSDLTHRKSMRLKEMSPTKQAGGKGETEKGKEPPAQKKRVRTMTRHST